MKKELINMLFLCLSVNIGLVIARIIYSHDLYFGFLIWNLFLAAVPLLISNSILRFERLKRKFLLPMLAAWLLFLPNAPYIITDFVHLYDRPPVPFWFDLVLLLFSTLNGLILGYISIKQVESVILGNQSYYYRQLFRIFIVLAMSYGVYLGRYLRFNSWDAFIRPVELARGIYFSLDNSTLAFVLTFALINFILYGFFSSILLSRSQEAF